MTKKANGIKKRSHISELKNNKGKVNRKMEEELKCPFCGASFTCLGIDDISEDGVTVYFECPTCLTNYEVYVSKGNLITHKIVYTLCGSKNIEKIRKVIENLKAKQN